MCFTNWHKICFSFQNLKPKTSAKKRRISFIDEESANSSFQDSRLALEPSTKEQSQKKTTETNESFRMWTEILKMQMTQKIDLVTVEENPILKQEEKTEDILDLINSRLETDPVIGVLENERVGEIADSKPEGNLTANACRSGDSSMVSLAVDADINMTAEVPGVDKSGRTETERNPDGISEICLAKEPQNETNADNVPVSVGHDFVDADKQAEILTDELSKTRSSTVRSSKRIDNIHSKNGKTKNSERTVSTSESSGTNHKEPGTRTRSSRSLSKCVKLTENQTVNSSLGNNQKSASRRSRGRSLSSDVVENEIRNPSSFAPSFDCKDAKDGQCEDDVGLHGRSLSTSHENCQRNEKKIETGDSKEIFSKSFSLCVKKSLSSNKHEPPKVPRDAPDTKSRCLNETSKREKKPHTSKHEQSSKKVDDKSPIPKKQ